MADIKPIERKEPQMTNELLNELNAFRTAEGKAAFADWRKARHMPMLEQYRAAAAEEVEGDEPDALMILPNGEMVRESELPVETVAEATRNRDFADPAITEAIKAEKAPAYKVLARMSGPKSGVDKPVGFVHQFLTEHPTLTRKEAIAALVQYGVNYSTARTQYQKWFSARKG
jgi:hypothetical protein